MGITPDMATGYVNNLTHTQEEKLRELWILLFSSAASILSAVYEVPLPNELPNKIFEVLDKINKPTVDAIVSALKGQNTNVESSNSVIPAQANNGESKEQKSLNKMESLMTKDAHQNIMLEMTTRKVSSEHFSVVFVRLREIGVHESEIKSMEDILSKMTPEEMCFAIPKMVKQEHPDSLLLRFLRARKWDVGKAFTMLITNILWRKQMAVDDDILPKGELYSLQRSRDEKLLAKERKEGKDFIAQLKMGKSFLHGFDRVGRPVNYVRVKNHKPGAQSEETLERYIVHVIEMTRLIVVSPVETGTIVFDMTGFSLSNMEYQPVKFIIKCFEANYPESLGLLLIHNAPWAFSGIWTLIRSWIDPVVASKVHFTRSVDDLDRFIHRNQIPGELAGDENWEYKYIEPEDDENSIMRDTQTRDALMFERMMIGLRILATTAAWISAVQGKEEQTTVDEIKSRRDAVVQEFRLNYWNLDPYIRERALIDRTGVLKPDGVVVENPDTNSETK